MRSLHLLKIERIEQVNADGKVVWAKENLLNVLHTAGEQYMLEAAFVGGPTANEFIPDNFWFGLDDRTSLLAADTQSDLLNEPSVNGYARQSIASKDGFVVALSGGINKGSAPIVTFSTAGGTWGPVSQLFMATTQNTSGILIASIGLGSSVTVPADDSINVRMSISLTDTV